MNNICVTGRAGGDPESRDFNGRAMCSFSLAVDRPRKDKDGNKQTDWFKVKLWGKQAEVAADYIRKGSKLGITGEVNIETWAGKDGGKQTSVVINANTFDLLDPRQSNGDDRQPVAAGRQSAPPPPPDTFFDDDDIPPF